MLEGENGPKLIQKTTVFGNRIVIEQSVNNFGCYLIKIKQLINTYPHSLKNTLVESQAYFFYLLLTYYIFYFILNIDINIYRNLL